MSLRLGSTLITSARLGSTLVNTMRLGSELVYAPNDMRDDFTGNDTGLNPAKWELVQGGTPYVAWIINDYCRLFIPGGLISESLRTASHKFIAAQSPDEQHQYLETRVATRGDNDSSLYTRVWSRVNNSAGFTHGVGYEFGGSNLYIVSKVAGNDLQREYCGVYLEGDTLRMVNNVRNHSLYRNGRFVGQWDDLAASAQMGAGYTSMAITVRGLKGFLGPRRFSPGLDYIECG